VAGPIEQFNVKTLVPLDFAGIDASFTNASAFMVAATGPWYTVGFSRWPK
jgi:hypothetical protein